MFIETIKLKNFRCFGPDGEVINLDEGLSAFVGANGTGKTAVMQAMLRMFGISNEQRRVRLQDFHILHDEEEAANERSFSIEVILAFPELDEPEEDGARAVPDFFHQMAADDEGTLKCRLRLEAEWTNDGSLDGIIETTFQAITTLDEAFDEDQAHNVNALERRRIQIIYVPAIRDAASQVSQFLKGRLWRAIKWSENVSDVLEESGQTLNDAFGEEVSVEQVSEAVRKRWNEVYTAGTDTSPIFRPIDLRLQEFIRKIEVVFHSDENGRDRSLADLSDGQNSLFHIAMTAATLDLERDIAAGEAEGFQEDSIALPALTLLAIEEPENNLSPHYLSRIVKQVQNVTEGPHAQALISSHSSSILARVKPEQVRHFRLQQDTRTAIIRSISLPDAAEAVGKYVREAVQAFPELYFAKFVVLGEGASEQIVLPRIAEAMGIPIDRSFVAVAPLGGRHVNHLWKLLKDLEIPFATLLDLDIGRHGGGWGRIKTTCQQLLALGHEPREVIGDEYDDEPIEEWLDDFDEKSYDREGMAELKEWLKHLRNFNVFFCRRLDLDWSMLKAFEDSYTELEDGMEGPSARGNAKRSVLGPEGAPDLYSNAHDERFKWYRYLFLGRGKPTTHIRVLSGLSDEEIRENAPKELKRLIDSIRPYIEPSQAPEDGD